MIDPSQLTATQAAKQISDGTLRVEELLEACLARIAADEARVRAFAYHDPALVRAAKPGPGKLHGLPIGVKDVLDTGDQPSQYGSPIWTGYQPRVDAACIASSRAVGGVVMGKTVTTEFATRKAGATTNPHNPAHTPGGSSSGSAAGVAAGFFPLAFGTQTGGSIIRPAAFCGVVGYKPSFGTIARLGMKVMSESLDTIGVMARSVADCAMFTAAVSNNDFGDPDRKPDAAPRIGLCPGPYGAVADAATMALLEDAAHRLSAAGAMVVQRPLPEAYAAMVDAHPLMQNAESAASMAWELATHRDAISPGLCHNLESAMAKGGDALTAARATITDLKARFAGVMDGVDILLTPSACGEAPCGIEWTGDPAFNSTWTALHVPCVTVPAGTGPAGLPLGIQIVGPVWSDRATLAWAQWVAAALG